MGLDPDAIRAEFGTDLPASSVHCVTMPGAVDAFCRLSQDHGVLGLDRLLAPAIHYAKNGVPVAPRVAFDWETDRVNLQGKARDYYLNNGRALKTGEIFRAPGTAQVLEKIARHGRSAFYEGEVAQDIIGSLTALGGTHGLSDLAAVQCEETTPVSGVYGEIEVCEHPPNGVGATALLILNILSKFDIASLDPRGARRAHLEAEATRLAYGLRNDLIADGAYSDVDTMLDDATATRLAGMVDPQKAGPMTTPQSGSPHKDTVYITAVDRDGMAVSLIYSIFNAFGSGIATERYGILLQNRGSGFTLQQGHRNEIGPGKRPLHTIIPGMVRRKGRIEMPFGVMGGQYQPCGHARLITNMQDFDMDIQTAIDAPRSFLTQGVLRIERTYGDSVAQELAAMGYHVDTEIPPIGGAQAIRLDPVSGVLSAGSDPRKDGCAIGY